MVDKYGMIDLNKWKNVRYRMDAAGMEYCFRHYSSFKEIEDDSFHLLRIWLLDIMDKMEKLVNDRINKLETQISEDDD